MVNFKSMNKQIQNVLHIPCVKKNLLSVDMIADQGCIIIFSSDKYRVMKEASPPIVVAKGLRDHRSCLYKLMAPQERKLMVNLLKKTKVQLWHQRLGHIDYTSVHSLS